MQVVQGVEAEREDLAGLEQVAEVGACERAAGVTGARRVDRSVVVGVAGVADDELAPAREEEPVPCGPGREHAVEHVDARRHAGEEVLGRPDAHEVARLVRRQPRARRARRPPTSARAPRPPRSRRARSQGGRARPPPRWRARAGREEPALRDPEERAWGSAAPSSASPPRDARHASRQRTSQRCVRASDSLVIRAVGERRRALVERHDDVRAERLLHLDRPLRREEMARAVEVGAERDALLGDRDEPGAGAVATRAPCSPRLKTWKPPESVRTAPPQRHEPVQPAEPLDPLVPGAEEQVVGVREDDAGAERLEVARLERLHGGGGADRHEDRRLDRAVRRREPAAAGGAVLREELEPDHAAGFARAERRVKAARAPRRRASATSARQARPLAPA